MKVAYLFSGQGSQYVGMQEIFKNHSSYSKKYLKLSEEILGYDISKIIKDGPIEKLNNTKYTQPAIFVISAIAFNIYKKEFGLPHCCAGHSLGEITALYSSEVLSFSDSLNLIQKRAENMNKAGKLNPGKMLAIIKPQNNHIDRIIENIPEIAIANINSEKQIILSGNLDSIENTIKFCKSEKIKAIPLPVSGAFHSSLMSPASDALLKTINELNFKDAIIPIYQNYTAKKTQDKVLIKDNLIKQITSVVKWEQTIKNMINDKISFFIELGPRKVLTNLNRTINKNIKCISFEEFIYEKQI